MSPEASRAFVVILFHFMKGFGHENIRIENLNITVAFPLSVPEPLC